MLAQIYLEKGAVVPMHSHENEQITHLLDGTELKMEVVVESPLIMKDQRGNTWNLWGRTIRGKDHPSELPLVDGYMAKWYEWVENFPATELVKPE